MQPPSRVCLSGASFTTGNMGVAALAKSLVAILTRIESNAEITFLIPNRLGGPVTVALAESEKTVEVVNYRLSPRAKPTTHMAWIMAAALIYRFVPLKSFRRTIAARFSAIRAVSEADWLGDIRGGDSFSDIYGLTRMVFRSFPLLLARILRTSYVLLPQTYGPFERRVARSLAAFTLKRASTIWSRDAMGESVVRELTRTKTARFCPDVAFMLPSRSPSVVEATPPIDTTGETELIGLNISGLLWSGGYSRSNMFGLAVNYPTLMRATVDRIRTECPDSSVLLVPHTYAKSEHVESDYHAILHLLDACGDDRSRLHVLDGAYDESELKWIIGRCSAFMGARMHSCIAALSQGVPTCGLAYSDKFRGVFDTLDLGSLVTDLRVESVDSILDSVAAMLNTRSELREKLRPINKQIQAKILGAFSEITGRAPVGIIDSSSS